jgi:hypothetical protein
MADRYERAARNQSLFREVNERIRDISTSVNGNAIEFVCECCDVDCTEPIQLTLRQYDAIRDHPNRFPVKPGHESHEVERVVERFDRYLVVEKLAAGREVAEQLDPRR